MLLLIMVGGFMINFVVVDNNKIHRKSICEIISKCMMINQIDYKIYEFIDFRDSLKKYINDSEDYSIYITELELPSCNGLDLARYIRNNTNDWTSPIIIDIDSSMYYDLLNQKLQILDFIPKLDSLYKSLSEDIDICLRILNYSLIYKYTYKNIEYNIPINMINYIQRDGRRTKFVTKNNIYYKNMAINEIKKIFPNYFIISAKGTLLNMKNVKEIDWKEMLVNFKDGSSNYVITNSHKKEIEEYEII